MNIILIRYSHNYEFFMDFDFLQHDEFTLKVNYPLFKRFE